MGDSVACVRLYALFTSAMCENAGGKFPSSRSSPGSYSSASRPTSLRSASRRSKSSRASSRRPASASAVAEREQGLKELPRLVAAAVERERVDEPERARQEDALTGREPVDALLGAIAEDEAVPRQLLPDRLHGRADARVVRREEADERQQQD